MARNPRPGTDETAPRDGEAAAAPSAPAAPAEKPRLRQRYERDVVPALVRDFNYQNPMQVPRLSKVSVNVGVVMYQPLEPFGLDGLTAIEVVGLVTSTLIVEVVCVVSTLPAASVDQYVIVC